MVVLTAIPAVLRVVLGIGLDDLGVGGLQVFAPGRLHLDERLSWTPRAVQADWVLSVGVLHSVHVGLLWCVDLFVCYRS